MDKESGGLLPGQKFDAADIRRMIRFQKAVVRYQRVAIAGKSEAELAPLGQEIEAVAPKDFSLGEFKDEFATRLAFNDYYRAAAGGGDKEKLAALSEKLVASKSKNPETWNQMAATILDDEKITNRDFELAVKLAKASVDASAGKEPAALDTYAHALYASGKTAEAVKWEQKAVDAATGGDMRKELEASLKKYQDQAAK